MEKLCLLFKYTDFYDQFRAFGRHLFSAIVEKLGWEAKPSESMADEKLAKKIIVNCGKYTRNTD
jgi:hypothetical protein